MTESVAERAKGALLGYVLGAGFGALTHGHRYTGEAAAETWPQRDELLHPAADLEAAVRGVAKPPAAACAAVEPFALAVALGVATPADPVDTLVATCRERVGGDAAPSDITAAVAAVATALSLTLAGGAWEESVALAMTAADGGAQGGTYVPGAPVSARLGWAQALALRAEGDPLDVIDLLIGTGAAPQESVAAAFALAALNRDQPGRAAIAARTLGGNSRSISAVAAALTGARAGTGVWPRDLLLLGESVLDVEGLAAELLALRPDHVTRGPRQPFTESSATASPPADFGPEQEHL